MDWTQKGQIWVRLVKHGLDSISKAWTALKSARLVRIRTGGGGGNKYKESQINY